MTKENINKEKNEIAYGKQLVLIKTKNEYVKNTFNARYHLARCNMIANQIEENKIIEKIDGCPKSKDLMVAEYILMRMQSIDGFRNAHFAEKDLKKDFGLSDEDLQALEDSYVVGKIIKENYDDKYKKGNKAEFVDSPEN